MKTEPYILAGFRYLDNTGILKYGPIARNPLPTVFTMPLSYWAILGISLSAVHEQGTRQYLQMTLINDVNN